MFMQNYADEFQIKYHVAYLRKKKIYTIVIIYYTFAFHLISS